MQAKKALRFLKAFVKLQALVRGYLVRKQAAATLHSTKALIRAQATVRARTARNLLQDDRRLQQEFRHQPPFERYAEVRSENMSSFHRRLSASLDNVSNGFDRSPEIVEIDTCHPKSSSSSRRTNPSVLDLAHDLHSSSISSPMPRQVPVVAHHTQHSPLHELIRQRACHADEERVRRRRGSPPLHERLQLPQLHGEHAVIRGEVEVAERTEAATGAVGDEEEAASEPSDGGARASLSGSMMQRSCTRVQEAFNFKTAAVGRLDRESYLQRKT
ncbi:hypothetical protein OPV22_017600 [Ensete ventricosum]|uniref:DUF4005 domain-containing protein n=1 Tax=Ensete ventricosum TaxID=4639 RepID=A0AAV8R029_ENSVE|nr:hypothetical protein OPV22_017600 [Ensete ventricosum]